MNRGRGGTAGLGGAVAAAVLTMILAGCAEVAPPPGGEVDKTGPTLLGSTPASGAVNVAPGNSIIIFFSEGVRQPSSGKGVFISPRPSRDPKLKWKTDRLEIVLPDSFQAQTTHMVALSADIADLRGNRLDSSTIIAFSTAPTIDSGAVAGYVYSQGKPAAGTLVGLFRAGTFQDSITAYDSLYPDYLGQASREGYFRFAFLPRQEYQLVAFDDKNRNERFEPKREGFALPDRPVVVGGDFPLENLQLALTTQDTASPEVIAAAYTADRIVRLRLSRTIPLDLMRQYAHNVTLRSQADTTQVITANALLESDTNVASILHVYFGALNDGLYQVDLTYDVSRPVISYGNLSVKNVADKNPPTIERFSPDSKPRFVSQVKMQAVFSEAVDTAKITPETFVLRQKSGGQVPFTAKWHDVFHLLLEPSKLREGESYTLAVSEFDVVDLAGNALGDSLREYSFSTLDADSLGMVSGDVVVAIPGQQDTPSELTFRKIGTDQSYETTASGHQFKIDLPAGRYLITGFVDSDLDGKRGYGSIIPFSLAETWMAFPDTVSVRARFETAGLHLEFK
ncbi:MAG TPA: Ig-like domain-containing protein [Candidatus Deferrimicrobium sp.]|nr:Ig-like domain-containing protein [Candidatus Deferrimicrobium sp.]